jgi:hypothetical protein
MRRPYATRVCANAAEQSMQVAHLLCVRLAALVP